jgi:putative phosphoesterase
MRILVFSDSHGDVARMKRVVERTEADLILYLGDGEADFETLQEDYHGRAMFLAVRGNCDVMSDLPAERLFAFEGIRILMLHGHTRGVKHGNERLEAMAKIQQADLVLYGHTHCAEDRYYPAEGEDKPFRLFNPGSIGSPGYGRPPRYGYIEIRDGQILSNCAVYKE